MTDKVGCGTGRAQSYRPRSRGMCRSCTGLAYPSRWRHIPIQEKDKRSFEALSAIVYRPEHLQEVIDTIARSWRKLVSFRHSMMSYTRSKRMWSTAAKKQGISQETQVTALADEAKKLLVSGCQPPNLSARPSSVFWMVPYCAEVSERKKCLGRGFCHLIRERQNGNCGMATPPMP